MIKRPFIGFGRPRLKYSTIDMMEEKNSIQEIPLPDRVTLLLKNLDINSGDIILKAGEKIKTGEKIVPVEGDGKYLISTVTGTISSLSEYTGYMGESFTTISVDVSSEDEWDNEFSETAANPSRENALNFLGQLPGCPNFESFLNFRPPVNTIIITGMDQDLLIRTNQVTLGHRGDILKKGIDYLKEITHVSKVIIVVPPLLVPAAEKLGIKTMEVKPLYPNMLPEMIMKNILGKVVPQGKSCVDMGFGFISPEAVISLGNAFETKKLPIHKTVTVIHKDETASIVRVRIGTPVKNILNVLGIEIGHGDRLILGGPLTGTAIYSEELPVTYSTDAIMVQDKSQITPASNTHCINCGECVRACPAKVPVNMLVRLLENGLYEEAATEYDLLSCIECGLCSYVCLARIPVFHYIMLGKHEFARIASLEESNA